jgi:hypothetical protein
MCFFAFHTILTNPVSSHWLQISHCILHGWIGLPHDSYSNDPLIKAKATAPSGPRINGGDFTVNMYYLERTELEQRVHVACRCEANVIKKE